MSAAPSSCWSRPGSSDQSGTSSGIGRRHRRTTPSRLPPEGFQDGRISGAELPDLGEQVPFTFAGAISPDGVPPPPVAIEADHVLGAAPPPPVHRSGVEMRRVAPLRAVPPPVGGQRHRLGAIQVHNRQSGAGRPDQPLHRAQLRIGRPPGLDPPHRGRRDTAADGQLPLADVGPPPERPQRPRQVQPPGLRRPRLRLIHSGESGRPCGRAQPPSATCG